MVRLSYLFSKDAFCNACVLGKHSKTSFKAKKVVSTHFPSQLLHLNLFGHSRTISLGKKKYGIVIVDDYSRFTWVLFLIDKDEAFEAFKTFKYRMRKDLALFPFV